MPLKETLVGLIALLLCTISAAQGQPWNGSEEPPRTPQNVILFVADGGGPASFTMARDYLRMQQGEDTTLALDSLQAGSIRTYSTSSRVTDSAAGATAFAAGVKTYNGAIAVDTLERPVATLLEAAEARGMATGLVATSRLTHATPASFAAHVPDRGMENEIADQMLAQGIEVLLGGGRRHFLPDTVEAPVDAEGAEAELGSRTDERDLLVEAREAGYEVVRTSSALRQARETPLLGLFTMSHMAYEADREPDREPSLAEMTRKTLDLLSDDPDGFFVMIEASRIDHAAHANDAAAHLYDVLAYNEAVAAALDFAREDGQTLVVATSDHETGGLTLGRGGTYAWHPEVLAEVEASHGPIVEAIAQDTSQAARVLRELAGLDSLSHGEQALLDEALQPGDGGETVDYARLNQALSEIIAQRAGVGWTTSGHTAVDVNLYAYGPGAERFEGHHDNTYVGRALAELLGFDLAALTEELRQRASTLEPVGSGR